MPERFPLQRLSRVMHHWDITEEQSKLNTLLKKANWCTDIIFPYIMQHKCYVKCMQRTLLKDGIF